MSNKRWLLLLVLCLVLTGCGNQNKQAPLVTTAYITYQVSTKDTVEILYETQDGFDIEGSTAKSRIVDNGETLGSIEFASTADVLSYTKGVVPITVAGYPCFKLPTEKADAAALVLGDNTSMILTAKNDYTSMIDAIDCCTIWCY
ncbi:MAG: hypothetical protein NC548_11010 [Lachnospiraceae bacterium]|nr:hypothetical protein [Lachnospiraceae bacterium]